MFFHIEFHFQISCWKFNGRRWMGRRNLIVSTRKFDSFGLRKSLMPQNVPLFLAVISEKIYNKPTQKAQLVIRHTVYLRSFFGCFRIFTNCWKQLLNVIYYFCCVRLAFPLKVEMPIISSIPELSRRLSTTSCSLRSTSPLVFFLSHTSFTSSLHMQCY